MKPPIRWGIVSTGRITHRFARDLATVSDGRMQAVYARRREAAMDFARQHDVPRAHDDLDEFLADPGVDAVYVATPHTLHHDHATAALEAGKAVLCEKPLTVNPRECRSLIATAERTGNYLMEALWTWFLPAIRHAVAWVEDGRIGALRQVQADFGYPQLPFDPDRREYDARLGGGCLLEMGIYPVAFDRLFHPGEPRNTQAFAHFAPNGVEDDLVWNLDYGDSTARLATSFRARLGNAATIVGDSGWILIPDFFRASECLLYDLDTCVEHFQDGRETLGFNFEIEAMHRDLRAGRRQSATVSHAHSLAFQERMEALRRSLSPGPNPDRPERGSEP